MSFYRLYIDYIYCLLYHILWSDLNSFLTDFILNNLLAALFGSFFCESFLMTVFNVWKLCSCFLCIFLQKIVFSKDEEVLLSYRVLHRGLPTCHPSFKTGQTSNTGGSSSVAHNGCTIAQLPKLS